MMKNHKRKPIIWLSLDLLIPRSAYKGLKVKWVLITLKNLLRHKKAVLLDNEKKKLKLKKNKYNDNYNEVHSKRLFEDISHYWNYLFNVDWAAMDPEFNRDSICKLSSF